MSTAPATASSSSSQSSRVSWQPSHEANFQTASVGRAALGHVSVLARPAAVRPRRRCTPARRGTRWWGRAGSARSGATAHFMLRSSDTSMSAAAHARGRAGPWPPNRIMSSGPHTNAAVLGGVQAQVVEQAGDHTDLPPPAWLGVVDGHERRRHRAGPASAAPRRGRAGRQAIEPRAGRPTWPNAGAVGQDRQHDGPQRRQPDAAGDDDDVAALGPLDRPRGAVRPPHADDVTLGHTAQRLGGRAHGADRVQERPPRCRVAADGDGHLADARTPTAC